MSQLYFDSNHKEYNDTDIFNITILQEKLEIMNQKAVETQQKVDELESLNDALSLQNAELQTRESEANMSMQSLEITRRSSIDYEQELRRDNDLLRQVIESGKLEIEKLCTDLFSAQQEHASVHEDYRNILNQNKILSEKLKVREASLKKARESLEKYDDEQNKWKNLELEHYNVQKQKQQLRNVNEKITHRNTDLMQKMDELKDSVMDREDAIGILAEKEEDYKAIVNEMKEEIQNLNEEIHHLKDSMTNNKSNVVINEPLTHFITPQDQDENNEIEMENLSGKESVTDTISEEDDEIEDESTPLIVRKEIVKTKQAKNCSCCRRMRVWPFW